MRVAVIVFRYPVVTQTFVTEPVQWLRDAGHDVRIVTEHRGRGFVQSDVVRRLDSVGARFDCLRHASRLASRARLPEIVGADVLLAHFGDVGARWLPVATRAQRPYAVYFHGYDATRLLKASPQRYDRLFASDTAILTNSTYLRDRLIAAGAAANRTHIVPLAAAPAFSASCEPPPLDGSVVLTIGRLVAKKGIADSLQAFAGASATGHRWRYDILGDGPQARSLTLMARHLGIADRVTFHGFLDRDATIDAIRRAAIFVLASRVARDGDAEGTPIAILEAATCGLPVVATRHAGIPDLLPPEAAREGFLVPEGDVDGLTAAITRLMQSRAERQRWGLACLTHARARYSAAGHVTALVKALATEARVPRVAPIGSPP